MTEPHIKTPVLRRILQELWYFCKVLMALVGHFIVQAVAVRLWYIDLYDTPLRMGEWLYRWIRPDILIDGEVAMNVALLDCLLLYGVLLLPLWFFLWGRRVFVGMLCLWIFLVVLDIWTIDLSRCL